MSAICLTCAVPCADFVARVKCGRGYCSERCAKAFDAVHVYGCPDCHPEARADYSLSRAKELVDPFTNGGKTDADVSDFIEGCRMVDALNVAFQPTRDAHVARLLETLPAVLYVPAMYGNARELRANSALREEIDRWYTRARYTHNALPAEGRLGHLMVLIEARMIILDISAAKYEAEGLMRVGAEHGSLEAVIADIVPLHETIKRLSERLRTVSNKMGDVSTPVMTVPTKNAVDKCLALAGAMSRIFEMMECL